MKKMIKRFSAAMLAIGMCAALTACGGDSKTTSADTQPETTAVTKAVTEAETELYALVNGKPVRVSSCGFKFDSAEAKTVLESLKIK